MAWNEPGKDDKKNQDPWNKNDKKNEQGPPDLDVIFQKISGFLKDLFGKKSTQGSSNKNNGKYYVLAVCAILIIVWFISGWYTVKESDRGVVLRLGAYHSQVDPGLHWSPKFIDQVIPVNVTLIRTMPTTGFMLTEDENIVQVAMEVQYRIVVPEKYLFSVTHPNNSLLQALDSALRYVIGHTPMDDILTTGRETVRQNTQVLLNATIEPYKLGIEIVDVNLQQTRPPEQVKNAFDDAIAAQEDEVRFKREAEAYAREKMPIANGQVTRIKEQAEAYKQGVVFKAQGAVAKFDLLLPVYLANPKVTRERLYIESMEKMLSNSSKVLIENKTGGNLTFLPLDQLMNKPISKTSHLPVETEIEMRSRKDTQSDKTEHLTSSKRDVSTTRSVGR